MRILGITLLAALAAMPAGCQRGQPGSRSQ